MKNPPTDVITKEEAQTVYKYDLLANPIPGWMGDFKPRWVHINIAYTMVVNMIRNVASSMKFIESFQDILLRSIGVAELQIEYGD